MSLSGRIVGRGDLAAGRDARLQRLELPGVRAALPGQSSCLGGGGRSFGAVWFGGVVGNGCNLGGGPFPEQMGVSGNDGVLGLYQASGKPVRAWGIGVFHQSGWDVAMSPMGVATVTGNENIQADPTEYTAELSVFGLVP